MKGKRFGVLVLFGVLLLCGSNAHAFAAVALGAESTPGVDVLGLLATQANMAARQSQADANLVYVCQWLTALLGLILPVFGTYVGATRLDRNRA